MSFLLLFLLLGTAYSYAYFIKRDVIKNVQFIVGELAYELISDTFEEGTHVTVEGNQTKELSITIQSKNVIESTYQLYYRLDDVSNLEQVQVEYWALPGDDPVTGEIEETGKKQVRIRITNSSDEAVALAFLITGGVGKQTLVLEENGMAITDDLKNVSLTFYSQSQVYNLDPTTWIFQGRSSINNDYSYQNTVGIEVYSNEALYTGVRIPIDLRQAKKNTTYFLSVRAYRTTDFSGKLRVYTGTFNDAGEELDVHYGIDITMDNLKKNEWTTYTYVFTTGDYADWQYLFIDFDEVNQGPVYISDIQLQEFDVVEHDYGEVMGTLPVAERRGYTFDGWYTASSGGSKVTSDSAVPGKDSVYYARWKEVELVFDTQNQIYELDSTKWNYQEGSFASSAYRYDNTNSIAVKSTALYSGALIPIDASQSKPNTEYRLSFRLYRTSDFSGNFRAYSSDFDENSLEISSHCGISVPAASLPVATWKSYTFTFTTSDYAIWPYISFDFDEVNQGPVYASNIQLREIIRQIKKYGEAIGDLPIPTRDGYTFLGWYTEPIGGEKIDSNTIVPEIGATYYAHWKEVLLTFDTQNQVYNPDPSTWWFGEGSRVDNNYSYNGTTGVLVNGGFQIPILTSQTKKNTEYRLSIRAYRTGDLPLNLRAYVATFNANNQPVNYYVSTITMSNLALNTWQQYQYTFVPEENTTWPWISINYPEVVQSPGYVSDIRLSEIIRLYKPKDEVMGELPIPVREGYTFQGWYTQPTGGEKIDANTIVPNRETTYYAQWK